MTTKNELLPTSDNLNDPYVLQLIEGLSSNQDDIEELEEEAGRLQLVAGRYQFMWQAAQLALNKIDDYFEYAYKGRTVDQIQDHVRKHLAIYTEAVSKSKAQIGK